MWHSKISTKKQEIGQKFDKIMYLGNEVTKKIGDLLNVVCFELSFTLSSRNYLMYRKSDGY
jgi:hypothetical protein